MKLALRLTVAASTSAVALSGALAGPAIGASDSDVPSSAGLLRPVDPRPTNEELTRALHRLERTTHGRVDVRSVGTTNEGRPIWFATVGHGPIRVLYVTQQHGNEPLGTPAAVEALRTIGRDNSRSARMLRERVTLGIIVRVNPDGHERDWRYNYDPDADPEFGRPGQGYDINRYHNPDLAPEDNPVPEAAAVQRTWLAFRPSIVVDYHMQGRYRTPDGRPVNTSVMWPLSPQAQPDVVDRSKQVTVLTYDALTGVGANVTQYPGGLYEGIARNAYGIRGSATMLMEISSLGPEWEQYQIATAYVSMLAIVRAAADGTLSTIDPARADDIPPRGPADSGQSMLDVADAA